MKTLYVFILSIILSSCAKEQMNDCFTATGIPATETRTITEFDSLVILRNIDVVLIEDTANFIQLSGGQNLLEGIQTRIENRILTLENTNRCHWVRKANNPIRAEVHSTRLRRIVHYGSGSIQTPQALLRDSLVFEFRDAAANAQIKVNNRFIQIIQHSGNSDVWLEGNTEQLTVYLSDLCTLNAFELSALQVFADQRSAADCYVKGLDGLRLETWADGSIYYSGEGIVLGKYSRGQGTISRIY
jgi:hypothetical protein